MDIFRQELAPLFAKNIAAKKIYLFASNDLNTSVPHYFICIVRTDGNLLYMTCCTSRFETVKKFVETRRLPFETLVFIKPKPQNPNLPFTKDTFVNCNNVFTYSVDELQQMFRRGEITFEGELSEGDYEQILRGIHASPLIEEDIKEHIPENLAD